MKRILAAIVLAWAGVALAAGVAIPSVDADFGRESASDEARYVAGWVLSTADHAGQPFVIVDKRAARVFVFDGSGRLQGAAPALLGLAHGDASVPGIGQRKMSTIQPAERTTPAGRFVAALATSLAGDDILWVDYDAAIALHRVIATVPSERRIQRLASSLPAEHRITYGCINVPVAFFDTVVAPAFRATSGVVYVLPEARPARELFGVR
jgi:hypothetical protein